MMMTLKENNYKEIIYIESITEDEVMEFNYAPYKK